MKLLSKVAIVLAVMFVLLAIAAAILVLAAVFYFRAMSFDQVLDHFNASNKATWQQHYWRNSLYFHGSGPVFLFIGGESEYSGSLIFGDSLVTQLAEDVGALIVALEHRYYGQSRPTPDASSENLKFLSMDQAVEDLVTFRDFINTKYNLTDRNKWVSMGCSYLGELSALLRLRHPDKIHAALASSAAIKFPLEYPEYSQIVNSVIKTGYSSNCASALEQTMSTVNSLFERREGRVFLSNTFKNQFGDLQNQRNVYWLKKWILEAWTDAVQYNPYLIPNLSDLCNTIVSSPFDKRVERLAKIVISYMDEIERPKKFQQLKEVSWNVVAKTDYERIWCYQACFDFATFPTSRSTDLPLGIDLPLSYYIDECRELFNETFSEEKLKSVIERRNQELGGDQFKGTRVVFVNGDRDPWSLAGLMDNSTVTSGNKVIVIEGASHCVDFLGYQKEHSSEVNKAVHEIKAQLLKYIFDWSEDDGRKH